MNTSPSQALGNALWQRHTHVALHQRGPRTEGVLLGAAIHDRHIDFVDGPLRRAAGRADTGDAQSWPIVIGQRARFDPQPPDLPAPSPSMVVARAHLIQSPPLVAREQGNSDALQTNEDPSQVAGSVPDTKMASGDSGAEAMSETNAAAARNALSAPLWAPDVARPRRGSNAAALAGRRAVERKPIAAAAGEDSTSKSQAEQAEQAAANLRANPASNVHANRPDAADASNAVPVPRAIGFDDARGESVPERSEVEPERQGEVTGRQLQTDATKPRGLPVSESTARALFDARSPVVNALMSVTMRMPMAAPAIWRAHDAATGQPPAVSATIAAHPTPLPVPVHMASATALPVATHGAIHRASDPLAAGPPPIIVMHAGRGCHASNLARSAGSAITATRTAPRVMIEPRLARADTRIASATREALARWPTATPLPRASSSSPKVQGASALPVLPQRTLRPHTLLARAPLVNVPSSTNRELAAAPVQEPAASPPDVAGFGAAAVEAAPGHSAINPSGAGAAPYVQRPDDPLGAQPVARFTDVSARALVNLLRDQGAQAGGQRNMIVDADGAVPSNAAAAGPPAHPPTLLTPLTPLTPPLPSAQRTGAAHEKEQEPFAQRVAPAGAAGSVESGMPTRVLARVTTTHPVAGRWSAMTVSPVAPDSGPRLAPSPTHRNSATGEPASRVAAVPTTDTPVLARSADVARELGEAGHAASSYELAQPFAEAGDMAIARAEQAGAHFVTRAAPVQAEQEAAHPVTPIARVQAVQTGTDPAARIAQVQRAFTPPASSALRTAVARDARRLPRPLLSGYGLPGRGADMDARRTDRDSAGPSLWVDRLADQYGVVPIDTQKTAARPAGAPPPAQSTSAPPAQTPADAMELAEKAWQIIQDKLAVERERRGYAPWP